MGEWIPENGDIVARCGPDLRRVEDPEELSKFVSRDEWSATEGRLKEFAFSSSRLYRPKKDFSNECGASEGLSVYRTDTWTHLERQQTLEHFYSKKDAAPECVTTTNATILREFRLPGQPECQILYVLDDPGKPGGPDHAIIRVRDQNPRPSINFIREFLQNAFKRFDSIS